MTERLEEIKKRLVLLHNAINVDDETKNYIFEDLKVEWLIERVEELEKDRDALEIKIDKAYADIHNLKRTLEFYGNEKNYETQVTNDRFEPFKHIEDDNGLKARKTLEELK